MKITRLAFKNFMGYKNLQLPNKKDEELPEGLILITGKNSYGKSTIIEGILFALFGSRAFRGKRRSKKAEAFISYGEKEAEIYIYFTLDEEDYYIYRKWGRTVKNVQSMFKFNKKNNRYEEIRKFKVEQFFEITLQQALNTIFVKQGEIEELSSKKGSTVRDMILKLFRLDIIDKTITFLDKDQKAREDEKTVLEKKRVPISRIEGEIVELENKIKENQKGIEEKSKKINENEIELTKLPSSDLLKVLDDLYDRNNLADNTLKSFRSSFNEKLIDNELEVEEFSTLEKITDKLNRLSIDKNKVETEKIEHDKLLDATNKGLGKTRGKIEDTKGKILKMQESQKMSFKNGQERGMCPLCQTELSKDHFTIIITQLEDQLKQENKKEGEISNLIIKHKKESDQFQKNLDDFNESIFLVNTLKNDYENVMKYQKEKDIVASELEEFLKENSEKVKDIEIDPQKIDQLLLYIDRLKTEVIRIKEEISDKQEVIDKDNKNIEAKLDEIEAMKALEKEIDDLEIDITHFKKVKEFVRRFVTEYMVTKRLVKNIALMAEKYIRDFTLGQYGQLLIDLEGSQKTGLSLQVKDHYNGVYESIEMISGGDRTALGMALRLAISELMKYIRPTKESPKNYPKIDFLLLDEPLAALHEDRREQILKHLLTSKVFSQIFLITHTAIPKDLSIHKIHVNKDTSTGLSYAKFERYNDYI